MEFSIGPVLLLGTLTVIAALVVLHQMVHWDLAPAARLAGKRRWLLIGALGAGVIAFTVKLTAIVAISGFSYFVDPGAGVAGNTASRSLSSGRRTGFGWVFLPDVQTGVEAVPRTAQPYVWEALPDVAPAPETNPTTAEKIALGRQLFNDAHLSKDRSISCASCHNLLEKGGGDGEPTALGIGGATGPRNTPTVWNSGFQNRFFWDGRSSSLEDQAKGPLLNPVEMGMPSLDAVEDRVKTRPHYAAAFTSAFGADAPITIDRIVEAIAAYERSLVTSDTPYDRFVNGDTQALSQQQIRGMGLFESLGCITCHHGPNFSSASVFDGGAPLRIFPATPTPFEKDYELLEKAHHREGGIRSAWRVPSLRNVALTGPWLHNGAVDDLSDMVRIMAAAQLGWSGHYLLWSEQKKTLQEIDRPVPSDDQVDDIVAFLHSLSSERLVAAQSDSGHAHISDSARHDELAHEPSPMVAYTAPRTESHVEEMSD